MYSVLSVAVERINVNKKKQTKKQQQQQQNNCDTLPFKFPSLALVSSCLSGRILDWRVSQPGFDRSFGNLVCLATLKSSDRTK